MRLSVTRIRFYPRASVLIPAAILIGIMLSCSRWQYQRYHEKLKYISEIERHLAEPVVPLQELINDPIDSLIFRRVSVSGTFDFSHEIVLRNRRFDGMPGVHVITPLSITVGDDNQPQQLLVSRGFIPLSLAGREQRAPFQTPHTTTFTAIIKESVPQRLFAPSDPPAGPSLPWVDAWLRVDIPRIGAQLPYPILPFYLEIIPPEQVNSLPLTIVQSHSDREEMLSMASRRPVSAPPNPADYSFPIPSPSTVVPAGRHRQYIYEWIILALLTLLGSMVLLLRPARMQKKISALQASHDRASA